MCKAVGTPKPLGIHAFSSFLPRKKARYQLQLSGILVNHWKKQPFCGVGKKGQSIPRMAQPWDPLESIQNHWKTSKYTRSHWTITFPAFFCVMANHSYRKALETITIDAETTPVIVEPFVC